MSEKTPAAGLDRRAFLKLVGSGAGAGAVALALPGVAVAAPVAVRPEPEEAGRLDAGYRETAHVRAYYDTCR
ncbi:MAG: twin-arginine translocation signal domain-containing protein [Lysobacterales bacterium]|nr:MAG: twin-arginine translocation signal domain-containing protein [Xanthomonadales bacterium]HMW42908.1 twin-arginine translocation signal domain-containing protein [Plasticicumulans sp.]